MMMRLLRVALVLCPALAFIVFAGFYIAKRWNDSSSGQPGKLVVVIVFDQMRGDYLKRWSSYYTPDGFERMKREGVWYSEAHLHYARSTTSPGHAGIATGVTPSVHGVIDNAWYDRKSAKNVTSMNSARGYGNVPSRPGRYGGAQAGDTPLSPDALLVPTIGDHLQELLGDQCRVFSLGLKDRAAALMGGRKPRGCYCYDPPSGQFHTSTYYANLPLPWVDEFNRVRFVDQWYGKSWDRLLDPEIYNKSVGPDDVEAETSDKQGRGRTFPHEFTKTAAPPDGSYFGTLEASPFGNELLWELAKTAITTEKLGKSGKTDLLYLGFSANDLIGHRWGPDSHEVMDVTLRSDRLMADILKFLDHRLGAGNYTVMITADHGVCPMPEVAKSRHPDAERFDPGKEFEGINEVIDGAFGDGAGKPTANKWVEQINYPEIYLNLKLIKEKGKKLEAIEDFVAQWAGGRPHSEKAYARNRILGPPDPADPDLTLVQKSFYPDRSGDVIVIPRAYCLPSGVISRGTTHGTIYDYDTHVPLLCFGAGIPALGEKPERVSSLLLAPIVCETLGVTPPERLAEKLPPDWVKPEPAKPETP